VNATTTALPVQCSFQQSEEAVSGQAAVNEVEREDSIAETDRRRLDGSCYCNAAHGKRRQDNPGHAAIEGEAEALKQGDEA
jgi:hypothetical protein